MKILLLGKNGQVGWELQRSLAPLGELIALGSKSTIYCGDLTNLEGLVQTIRTIAPDVIVNAAAYTAVDQAEREPEAAFIVNTTAVELLANEAKRLDAWLVHYSTDYVFDGQGSAAWLETDATAPLSVYGESKLAGELAIAASGCKHLIFRTSWVYAARGKNFAKTILNLAQQWETLKVIDEQVGAPTGADLLADVTAHAIRTALHQPDVSGLYHLVASGYVSWHGYANFVIDFARKKGMNIKVAAKDIEPVAASEFPTLAARPLNSRLSTHKLQDTFNLVLPHWQLGVERMLQETL